MKSITPPLRPTLDQVLLEEVKKPNTSVGGILLSGKEKEKKVYVVHAVGPIGSVRDKDVQMMLHSGDKVIINESKSEEVSYDGKIYKFIRQEYVLAHVTN